MGTDGVELAAVGHGRSVTYVDRPATLSTSSRRAPSRTPRSSPGPANGGKEGSAAPRPQHRGRGAARPLSYTAERRGDAAAGLALHEQRYRVHHLGRPDRVGLGVDGAGLHVRVTQQRRGRQRLAAAAGPSSSRNGRTRVRSRRMGAPSWWRLDPPPGERGGRPFRVAALSRPAPAAVATPGQSSAPSRQATSGPPPPTTTPGAGCTPAAPQRSAGPT